MHIALRYTLFALVATIANIGSQDVSLRLYQGAHDITLSIMLGTALGLLIKYVLDKHYIFSFQANSLRHDTQTILLYTAMGLLTTLVFWGFEFGFHYLFGSKSMRYTGGVLGLAIGYWLKYRLDKRFVFIPRGA